MKICRNPKRCALPPASALADALFVSDTRKPQLSVQKISRCLFSCTPLLAVVGLFCFNSPLSDGVSDTLKIPRPLGRLGFLFTAALLGCSPLASSEAVYDNEKVAEKLSRVLIFGLDGVRPDALQKAYTPNLDCLASIGSYSYRVLGGTYTVSGPSWSNIFTGVWENKHGVTNNDFEGSNYENYPSFFTRIETIRPELHTVSLDSWRINEMINTRADETFYHSYKDYGDIFVSEYAKRVLNSKGPDVMFVYFIGPDCAGHAHGFSPDVPEYIKAIEEADVKVGELLDILYRRNDKDEWAVIAVTDHGGIGKGHGGQSLEERTVFYISNKGAGEIQPPPAHVDIVPTVFHYLGIPVKEEWNLDGKILY